MISQAEHGPRTQGVLVVTPRGGALEGFARRASERWRVSLARDRLTALGCWGRASPSVAVVELQLGARADDGLELCRELRGVAKRLLLVLVTPLASSRQRMQALELGVNDCVPQPVDSDELCALLRARLGAMVEELPVAAANGRNSAGVARRVRELTNAYALSPREAELLLLVTRGAHPKEAAARLGCGHSTARTHLRRLAKKLGCTGTRDVLVRFFNRDLEEGEAGPPGPKAPFGRLLNHP